MRPQESGQFLVAGIGLKTALLKAIAGAEKFVIVGGGLPLGFIGTTPTLVAPAWTRILGKRNGTTAYEPEILFRQSMGCGAYVTHDRR